MPTVAARIDANLAGNDLSARLTVQADQLAALGSTVAGLIEDPPDSVGDIARTLAELPLPDLDVTGSLAGTLGDLRAALPDEPVELTEELLGGFEDLRGTVDAEITARLEATLEAIRALERLGRIDLRCAPAEGGESGEPGAGEAGGGGEPEPGEGGEGPGGATGEGGAGGTAVLPAPVATLTERIDAALDALPDPLTAQSALEGLNALLTIPQRDSLLPTFLPIYDGLRDPLDTLTTWDGMTGEQIRGHFAASLGAAGDLARGTVDAVFAALAADLAALAPAIGAEELDAVASGLVARLQELAPAVRAGDLAGVAPAVAALGPLLDRFEAARSRLEADAFHQLEPLAARAAALPGDLDDRMVVLGSALGGSEASTRVMQTIAGVLEDDAREQAVADLTAELSTYVAWLQDLVAKVDVSVLAEPLGAAAGTAREAVDGLDAAMVALTLQARDLFAEAEALLDEIDTEEMREQVEEAIAGFRDDLVDRLDQLFAPARDAVGEVVGAIDEGVEAFDPADIVEALRGVVTALGDVLEDPAVAGPAEQVRTTIAGVTAQIEALSFAPITDEVVAAIDEVAEILRGLDTSALGTAATLALQAALAVLPEDLTPVTDPIVAEFGAIVEGGPVPLLEQARAQPARLLEQVRRFEPAALVGDELSAPWQGLLARMDEFRPSALLEPVAAQLETLKARLRENARPGLALEPLEGLFDELLAGFDSLRPEAVVAPLEEALGSAIDQVLAASPVDELLAGFDAVLGHIRQIASVCDALLTPVRRLRDALAQLAAAPAELEAWIDEILARVEPLADDGTLAPALAEVAAALDATRAAELGVRFDSALAPVRGPLDALEPARRLTSIVQAARAVPRASVFALADSAEKTDLLAALDRLDPLSPAFARPWRALADFGDALAAARAALDGTLASWDARHHDPDGPLAALRGADPAPAALTASVRAVLERRFVEPVGALFSLAGPIHAGVGALTAQLELLMTDVNAKLTGLLLGPDSLEGIRDALAGLVERLRGLDLDFLSENLSALFARVRAKLAALDPAGLRELVDAAFDEMLEALDLDAVIPPAEVASLDASYGEVVAKLRALDPGALVVEVVQPEFEASVVPLLAAFDITPPLDALIARLETLDDELRSELARVNEAYQRLRDAVPDLSLSLDVDIDVDLPF